MGGTAAKKLLERMRNSPSGWGQSDFEKLLVGYNFKQRQGKHTVYMHPNHPSLMIVVPRHNELKDWVARDAVKLIDELEKLEGEKKDE